MENEKKLSSGAMSMADYSYEEFEGLLGSIYKSLKPLAESKDINDTSDFGSAVGILEGFTRRHNLMNIEDIDLKPRQTEYEWGQPREKDCYGLFDSLSSFWRDFDIGVGGEIDSEKDPVEFKDTIERQHLSLIVKRVLDRYEGLKPKNSGMTLRELITRK